MRQDINTALDKLYQNYPEIPFVDSDRDINTWAKKVSLGTESLVPLRNMQRTPEGLLPGDIILLWRISLGTYTTESWTPKYFEYDYGIDCAASLEHLIAQGYALKNPASQSLDYVPAPVLKSILKTKGLKGISKMNKADLMAAVLSHTSPKELEDLVEIRVYSLTQKGQAALDNNSTVVDRHPKKPGYSK